MSEHGGYRTLHHSAATAEAAGRDEMLVTAGDVLVVGAGTHAAVAVHVVAEPGFWRRDEPAGYAVELVRPHWMYGNEGQLRPLRWVGRVDDLTGDELDAMTDDDPYWELVPQNGPFLWAVPRVAGPWSGGRQWSRCEVPWWQVFRVHGLV